MIQPAIYTWIIAVFGVITFVPLLVAQIKMIFNLQSQQTKDLIIGKEIHFLVVRLVGEIHIFPGVLFELKVLNPNFKK